MEGGGQTSLKVMFEGNMKQGREPCSGVQLNASTTSGTSTFAIRTRGSPKPGTNDVCCEIARC